MTPPGPVETLPADILERLMALRKQFLRFLTKRVGSETVAEEILQAAFVRGFEKGGQIRDEDSAVAWFYRMLRNAVIDYYRHRDASDRALSEFASEMEAQEQAPPEVFDEVCRCVSSLAETLKPEYRQALQIIDIEEGRLADLAAEAGITTDNAATRIHRARRTLRERVQVTCGMCAQHGCQNCSCRPSPA